MEKQTTNCITQENKELGHKLIFSELFPQKNPDNKRNSYNESIQKLPHQKNSNQNYVTFKCQIKKSNPNNQKQNCNKLPMINCPKKPALFDKYFSRNDIVKDRSENIDKNFSNYLEEITLNQSTQNTNYKQVQPKYVQIERFKKSQTKHNKTIDKIGQKSTIYQKTKNLEEQMREWALIKKKNEYQVCKLMRKNNYQRIKSNMIIAQVIKELLEKRQQLLADEDNNE